MLMEEMKIEARECLYEHRDCLFVDFPDDDNAIVAATITELMQPIDVFGDQFFTGTVPRSVPTFCIQWAIA